MSTGAIAASEWLLGMPTKNLLSKFRVLTDETLCTAAQMRSYDFHCTPHSFLSGFSPMLECVYNRSGKGSDANETVVLGAHYDSRGVSLPAHHRHRDCPAKLTSDIPG